MSRFRGSLDVPLNGEGAGDAVKAAIALPDVDYLVHDWQQRTRVTAEIIKAVKRHGELMEWDVSSQHMGWLEGREITDCTIMLLNYYVSHPSIIPHPSFLEDGRPPESFSTWLSRFFDSFDQLEAWSERENARIAIITHNRCIQAIRARHGWSWIDYDIYNRPGARPGEVWQYNPKIWLVRHGSTDFGG